MKKILLIIFVLAFSSLVLAEEQPNLLNHQFFGEVTWAKDAPVPSTITAMLGEGIFTAEVRSSPCLEDPCMGRYGYDADNILRVQGNSGTVLFIIDDVEVGEYQYQEDAVTKLDFDLRPEEPAPSDGGSSGGGGEEVVNETIEPAPLPEVTEVVQPTPVVKTPPKEIPTFKIPPPPALSVQETEKEGGLNPYLIGGIVLIVAAIAVVAFLIIKKRREVQEF